MGPGLLGYLVLEATGREPKQYRHVGWAEVYARDYNSLLQDTRRESVYIV